MKKILSINFILLLTALSGFAEVQDHTDPHGNGFRLNFHFGLTGVLYGADVNANKDLYKVIKPGVNWGLSLGNKWTVYRFQDDKMSFGVMVDWIDFSIANKNINNLGVSNTVGNFSFLKIGPSFTYALTDKIGLDLYYSLRPTAAVSIIEDSIGNDVSVGGGLTHAVGVGFRYGILNVAFEPNFGNVETVNTDVSTLISNTSMANTRIVVGFKF